MTTPASPQSGSPRSPIGVTSYIGGTSKKFTKTYDRSPGDLEFQKFERQLKTTDGFGREEIGGIGARSIVGADSPVGALGSVFEEDEVGAKKDVLDSPSTEKASRLVLTKKIIGSKKPVKGEKTRVRLRKKPIDDESVIGLRPLGSGKAKAATVAGRIWLGTQSSRGGTTTSVEQHNIDKQNQKKLGEAFQNLFDKVKPAFPNMKYMTVNLYTLTFTIHNNNGTTEDVDISKVRDEIVNTLAASGTSRVIARRTVKAELADLITDLRRVAARSGLDDIWPYSSRGEEVRGNIVAGRPMHTPLTVVQGHHFANLSEGVKKNQPSLERLVESSRPKTPDDAAEKEDQDKAITENILYIEIFLKKLHKKLEDKITEQQGALKSNPTDPDKVAKEKQIKDFMILKNKIETETDRRALYQAYMFSKAPGKNEEEAAEDCYDAICHELHLASVAQKEQEKGYPTKIGEKLHLLTPEPQISFDDFMRSPDGELAKEYAADVASTMISDVEKYKKFCKKHDAPLKQDHVNTFLLEALKSRGSAYHYNFTSLGLDLDEKRLVNRMISEARLEAGWVPGGALNSGNTGTVHAGEPSVVKRLEGAFKIPGLGL